MRVHLRKLGATAVVRFYPRRPPARMQLKRHVTRVCQRLRKTVYIIFTRNYLIIILFVHVVFSYENDFPFNTRSRTGRRYFRILFLIITIRLTTESYEQVRRLYEFAATRAKQSACCTILIIINNNVYQSRFLMFLFNFTPR